MRKRLLALWMVLLLPARLPADTVTFTSAADQGTYPATVKCDHKTIIADLSALGHQARIVRAVLRPAGDIAGRVRSPRVQGPAAGDAGRWHRGQAAGAGFRRDTSASTPPPQWRRH